MRALPIFLIALALLSGCNATPVINFANDAKCKTTIAKKDSKVVCEIEGKRLLGKNK